jgi:hypothetical protein
MDPILRHKTAPARIKKICSFIFLVLCFITCFPEKSLAKTIVTIKPMITVTSRLEGNFYRTETQERKVYTYIVQPGIELSVETAKSKTSFSYTLNAYFYDDQSDVPPGEQAADEENYTGHFLDMETRYALTDRMTIGLSDNFYVTRRVELYDDYKDYTARRKHWINRFTPRLHYSFGDRFSLGLRYQRQDYNYEDTDIGDAVEHRGVLDLIYHPSRTVTLDLDYQHWKQQYKDETPDYTSNQVGMRLQKRFRYFYLGAKAGYHHRHYEDSIQPDVNTPVFNVIVGVSDPPIPGFGGRLYGETPLRTKTQIHFDYTRDLNLLGEQRTEDRFTFSLGRPFLKKINITFRGFYTISKYESASGSTPAGTIEVREDDTYGIEGSIRYRINDHWNLLISTGLRYRDSNLTGFSHEDEYVTFNLAFGYPFQPGRYKD